MKTRNLLFAAVAVLLLTVTFSGSADAAKFFDTPAITYVDWLDDTTTGSHILSASNITVKGAPSGATLVLVALKSSGEWFSISDRVAVKGNKTFSLTSRALAFTGEGDHVDVYLVLMDKTGKTLDSKLYPVPFTVCPEWVP